MTRNLFQQDTFCNKPNHPHIHCENNKQGHVTLLISVQHVFIKIESKTGLEKSTIRRINEEVDGGKENSKRGCPSKLCSGDKQSIACQIASGRLDNAVEVTHFINNILPDPVTPQAVGNSLKQDDFHAVIKRKCSLLRKVQRLMCLKFSRYHENWTVEDWKRILWSDETKINRIRSNGRIYTWKKRGKPLSDRTATPTVKHGGGNNFMVWSCIGWNGVGVLTEVQGIIMESNTVKF